MTTNCTGAVQAMWKKPRQKSIRETSVLMWLTRRELGMAIRALPVMTSERR